MNTDPQSPGPGTAARLRRLATAIVWWIDPEENPSGLVYGTIAVGAVLRPPGDCGTPSCARPRS